MNANTNYSSPKNNLPDYLNLFTKDRELSLLAHNKTDDAIKTISEKLFYLDLADQSNKRAIAASIGFTGKNFKPDTMISTSKMDELIEAEILTPLTKHVITYEKEDYKKLFNFKDNGFEYLACSPKFLNTLNRVDISTLSPNGLSTLKQELQAIVKEWATKQGIDFTDIIPMDFVYRSTAKESVGSDAIGGTRPPVTMSHIDFHPEGQLDFLPEGFRDNITPHYEITQMVNVWLPLQPEPTKNTLAMMDVKRLRPEDLVPSTAEVSLPSGDSVQFKSLAINSSKRHQFVIQSDMKLGDMVIFDSMRTPHAAVDISRPNINEELPRKSLELRLMFGKAKKGI